MKKIVFLVALCFVAILGGCFCEATYKTFLVADCTNLVFLRKHYLLGVCVLTEYVDTPLINGGMNFACMDMDEGYTQNGYFVKIHCQDYIDYDPRHLFDIDRVRQGHRFVYLIRREEEVLTRSILTPKPRDVIFKCLETGGVEVAESFLMNDVCEGLDK